MEPWWAGPGRHPPQLAVAQARLCGSSADGEKEFAK